MSVYDDGRKDERLALVAFLNEVVPMYANSALAAMPDELIASGTPREVAVLLLYAALADVVNAVENGGHLVTLTAAGKAALGAVRN